MSQYSQHPISSQTTLQANGRHYHPMNTDKICCIKHVIDICTFLKQQKSGSQLTTPEEQLDFNTKKTFFLLCNEHASRFTVSGELDKAYALLERSQQLSHEMPNHLRATLFSNISCYYEKINDDRTAMLYLEQALQEESKSGPGEMDPKELIGVAINNNNMAVIELKQGNFTNAFKASKKAVMMMEPIIFAEIKAVNEKQLKNEKVFIDKLQVLLVSYFNLGITQCKVGNVSNAKTAFEQGYKMSKKFFGEEHFFAQKFMRRVEKPLGNNYQTSPQRSLKIDTQSRIGRLDSNQGDGTVKNQSQFGTPTSEMNVINKEKRKIITNARLVKDGSSSGLERLESNSIVSQPIMQRRDSKKRSELMNMVRESQRDKNNISNYQAESDLLSDGDRSRETKQRKSDKENSKREEELDKIRKYEEDLKYRQDKLIKEKDDENQKLKDIILALSQNQNDLTKRWDDFSKKQDDFEKKILTDKEKSVGKTQEEEMLRVQKQKESSQKQIQLQQQLEAQRQAEESKKVKEADPKMNQVELILQDAKNSFQEERQKFLSDYQNMMKQMNDQQEKQQQMMLQQQQDLLNQKRLLQQQQDKLEQERIDMAKQQQVKQQQQQQQQESLQAQTLKQDNLLSDQTSPKKLLKEYSIVKSTHDLQTKNRESEGKQQELLQSRKKEEFKSEEQSIKLIIEKDSAPRKEEMAAKSPTSSQASQDLKLQPSISIPIESDNYRLANPNSSSITSTTKDLALNQSKYSFTNEQFNDILEEDQKLYDASIILMHLFKNQELSPFKVVSQVIYCGGLYYKMYCEGFFQNENKPCFKFYGICEDPRIQISEEVLHFYELKSILKLLIVKDILPPCVPIKNIRSFENLCKYFIFPFLLITNEARTLADNDDTQNKGSITNSPQNSINQSQNQSQTGNQVRSVELWGRAPGLFSVEVHIIFLKNICNVSLHYIHERYFRLAITSLDGENANSIYLDLQFDESSFEKKFQIIDAQNFDTHGFKPPGEECIIPSLKIVDKDFIHDIEDGIKAFENYLANEFGQDVQFNYLVYERSGLIYQIRMKEDATLQELWCVKDDIKNSCLRVNCKTLYEVRLRKHVKEIVERTFNIAYQQLWVHFGVQCKKDKLDRSQLKLFSSLILQTLFLHMPTMELNKGDQEDSDYEEEVIIGQKKIECIIHMRKLLDILGDKIPLTIQLLGYDQTYLGIKVSAYNPFTIKDLGFFFVVNQKYWEFTDEEKAAVPKKRTMKSDYLTDYYHLPEQLRKTGFNYIFNNLVLKTSQRLVRWKGPSGDKIVDNGKRNLSDNTDEEEVKQNFQRFGEIKTVQRKKDYAIIEYITYKNAVAAINEMNGIRIDDNEVKVEMAWYTNRKPYQNNPETNTNGGSFTPNGGGSSGNSYYGGGSYQSSYSKREPPKLEKQSPARNSTYGGNKCFTCDQSGHWSTNCPLKMQRVYQQVQCYNCGKNGHWASVCQEEKKSPQESTCFKCSKGGHYARDCTVPQQYNKK